MILDCFSVSQRLTQNGFLFSEMTELLTQLYVRYKQQGYNLAIDYESTTVDYLIKHNSR